MSQTTVTIATNTCNLVFKAKEALAIDLRMELDSVINLNGKAAIEFVSKHMKSIVIGIGTYNSAFIECSLQTGNLAKTKPLVCNLTITYLDVG